MRSAASANWGGVECWKRLKLEYNLGPVYKEVGDPRYCRSGYMWRGHLHLSCKRDQIKMRDYMDRRVPPP